MRELWAAVRGVIVDTIVESWDVVTGRVKATWAGDQRITPDVEVLFPQGVYFGIPPGAHGVLLAPLADPSRAKALVQGSTPGVMIPPMLSGEGGLHYLGAWRVFVNADGVILGADPSGVVYPLVRADRLLVELAAIKAHIDAHTHTVPITGAAGTTASTPPLTPMTTPTNAACDKIKGL